MRHILFIFMFFTCLYTKAQQTYTISGKVNDEKGESLPGATVFLTNTKHIVATDANGKFVFNNMGSGTYEIVVKMIGYTPYVNKINIQDKSVVIEAKLNEDSKLLNTVTIKTTDPNRDKYMALFTKYFIGESTNADQCKILNPQVLHFQYDKATEILQASTEKLLIIENNGLGYKINYLLTNFTFDAKNLILSYAGYPYLEELTGTPEQQKKWDKNRQTAYLGSMHQFLRAAFNHTASAEGFAVYMFSKPKLAQQAEIKLNQGTGSITGVIPAKADKNAKPSFIQISADSLFTTVDKNTKQLKASYYSLSSNDSSGLYILYKQVKVPFLFTKSGMYIEPPAKLAQGQLSKLEPLTAPLQIDKNGDLTPAKGFLVSGYWAWEKISELLPAEYHTDDITPVQNVAANATVPVNKLDEITEKFFTHSATHPIEKIYLQLNKPRYNRADTIWFKAYTVVGSNHQLSGLSGVAYVELVSPNDTVIQRLKLGLRSGMANGDFTLPLTLKAGNYHIRAYTNWMKNEGEQYFYDQVINIGGIPVTSTTLITSTTTTTLTTDIQFFPEGGSLVNGLRSRVAFKATNPDGTAAEVSGFVQSSHGDTAAVFESGHAGMGVFAITPQAGISYTAKLQSGNGNVQTISLPQAVNDGYVLTINNTAQDTLYVSIAANPLLLQNNPGSGFYLVAQSGGTIRYTASGKTGEGAYRVSIPKNRFPSGIARLTLFSATGEPLNERIAFIQQPDNMELKITTHKTTYAENEKIDLSVNAGTVLNQPVAAALSAAVINESLVPTDEAAEPTIFSQLLLSSELHGHISDPGYYFNNANKQTMADLDLLMLTQGYRKLEWMKLTDTTQNTPAFLAEQGLSISGTVKTKDGKPVVNGKVSVISAQLFLKADTVTDSNGRFTITGLDITGPTPLIVKAQNGKSNEVMITLDGERKTNAATLNTLRTVNTTAAPVVTAAMQQTYKEDEEFFKTKGKQLKEVSITEKAKKQEQDMSSSANLHGGGNADQVIMGKQLEEMGCPVIIKCLEILITSHRRPNLFTPTEAMKVYIDGTTGSLDNISQYDIYSVEVLTSVKYKAIYGREAAGGLLIITTKKGSSGNELIPTAKAPGLVSFTYNGYYKARTFYIPKYNETNAAVISQRTAIYWEPNIITGADGKANLTYPNAGKGNYRVVIEGIDDEGHLGRQVYTYKVE